MRTNIVIDPTLMESAMRAGPYKTKKDAVEAGLKLLARQASYRDILRWEGKLRWDDGVEAQPLDASAAAPSASARVTRLSAHEPGAQAALASPLLTDATQEPTRRGRR